MADEKKGITVKIDADLHAEIREYLERHEGMTMAEFITLAVDDELHPKIQQKEGNNMGNIATASAARSLRSKRLRAAAVPRRINRIRTIRSLLRPAI